MEFTVIYSKSLVTELFTEVCESNEGLYFHSQHQTNRIEACDIAPVQLLMNPTTVCMLWKALITVALLNISSVSSVFELACLGRAQKLIVMKSVGCEMCCFSVFIILQGTVSLQQVSGKKTFLLKVRVFLKINVQKGFGKN